MTKKSLDSQFPWEKDLKIRRRRRVKPVRTYFTDQALPPDGHVEPCSDDSDLLEGLWPEATKNWFVWNENEKPRVVKVAVDVEKLCGDYNVGRWWREKVKKFVEFKAAYDEKKITGKYVDPSQDWPFSSDHPREVVLAGDLPALYTILGRFHDWMIGFDQIFSEENAVYEFLSDSSHPYFEQRPVHIEELETFLEHVKKDLEAHCVQQQEEKNLLEKKRRIPNNDNKGLLKKSTPKDNESKEISWSDDDPNYMLNSKAVVKFTNSKMSLPKLTKELKKPNNEIHHMQKGQRCKVHIGDFIKYAKQHYPSDDAAAEIANEYLADIEARKLQERLNKTNK